MNGQMTLQGRIGATLNGIARSRDVEKVLEIGTYNGQGSTYCIADALFRSTGRLRSVEVDRGLYDEARSFYAGTGLPVELEYGLTLRPEEILPFERFADAIGRTAYEAEAPGTHKMWYERDIELARGAERKDVLRELLARDRWYDLVFFDGGEYTAEAEFHLLEPHISGYVVLDDANPLRSIKNASNREWLLASPDWEMLVDEPDDRCGWCVAKRR